MENKFIVNDIAELAKLAASFGVDKENKNFRNAFNRTKISSDRAKTSKGCYANSALATVGDAVIRLFLTDKYYKPGADSSEITELRSIQENNKNLGDMAKYYGWDKLAFVKKQNQPSDKPNSDNGTLFEAVIGAIFLIKDYDHTKIKLDELWIWEWDSEIKSEC